MVSVAPGADDSREPRACWQHTLSRAVVLSGIGLHRGQPQRMRLQPASPDTGIVFVRTDLAGRPRIVARPEHVIDTRLCTTLSAHQDPSAPRVQTVEHLLSALSGVGIDNVEIELDGEEVPVLDGSAAPIVTALQRVGRRRQARQRIALLVTAPIEVQDGSRIAKLLPPPAGSRHLHVSCQLIFAHALIPRATFVYRHEAAAYRRELAPARTFGFLRDIEALRAHGLTLGGSLDNAVVFDADSVRNPEGLRFADECVRHKVLDALGDLMLLGCAVIGELHLLRSGHALHVALAQRVQQSPDKVIRAPMADVLSRLLVSGRKGRAARLAGGAAPPMAP